MMSARWMTMWMTMLDVVVMGTGFTFSKTNGHTSCTMFKVMVTIGDDAVTGDDPDRRRNVVHQISHGAYVMMIGMLLTEHRKYSQCCSLTLLTLCINERCLMQFKMWFNMMLNVTRKINGFQRSGSRCSRCFYIKDI